MYTKRVHPELGYDPLSERWYVTGDNSFRVKHHYLALSAIFCSDEKRWYFPKDQDPRVIAITNEKAKWELSQIHFKDPNSKAGRKRQRKAEKAGIDILEVPKPTFKRQIDQVNNLNSMAGSKRQRKAEEAAIDSLEVPQSGDKRQMDQATHPIDPSK
jgi:hypothetical protein